MVTNCLAIILSFLLCNTGYVTKRAAPLTTTKYYNIFLYLIFKIFSLVDLVISPYKSGENSVLQIRSCVLN